MIYPKKTLLQGCKYTPSWLHKPPTRYTIPYLCGSNGLQGKLRNQPIEGSAKEEK